MKLPQIRMESQMAKISIKQARGIQELRQPKAKLSIEQPKASMSMRTIPSKLTIDQTQAWEEMNLMSTPRLIEKQAQEGYQAFLEGTERRARQGTELMQIEKKGNPIYQHAIENGTRPVPRIGLKYIPSPFSVKIHYEPSRVEIDIQMNRPIIHAIPQKPEHNYQPGKVDIQMQQYQDLKIDFVHLFSETV